MKRRYFSHIGIIITGLVLHLSVSIAGNCKVPSGNAWTNELGSEMTVNIDTSGAITGTYSSAVGCGATTAWSGTYGDGIITTLRQFVSAKKPS